jgi:mannonate dehydratase
LSVRIRRRDFVKGALALPAALLAGCEFTFEDGVFNECRAEIGNRAIVDPFLAAAWKGLDPAKVWDSHAHLFGNGRGGGGIWLSPAYDNPFSVMRARRTFFLDGACGGTYDSKTDERVVQRIAHLADAMPPGARVVLLAFELAHDESGMPRKEHSAFWVPNETAARVAHTRRDRFEWMASIHPYRPDAIEALEAAKREGARGVKWLPPAMGIDPASPRCRPFYEALKRLDIPLLVHVGEERAVQGAEQAPFANPLLLRTPLDIGVRVIAAHCATMGTSADLDADRNPSKAPQARNIDLFARLMAERRYEGLLFGDISAVTQTNRMEHLPLLLEHRDWHPRLLNGSDYPLPGVMPLFSLSRLVKLGVLEESAVPAIKELRRANALLFDFTLKRALRYRGSRFADSVFHTRDFFLRSAQAHG